MSLFDIPWLSYFTITMLISAPFYFALQRLSKSENAQLERRVRQLMWIPGITAFGIRMYSGSGFADVGLGLGRSPWLLPAALLAPVLMEVLLVLVVHQFKLAVLDTSIFRFKGGQVYVSERIRLILGSGRQPLFQFILNLLATVAIGSMVMLIFSFAEEFGWRGYLQDQVIRTFGLGPGLVFGGILWGAWYAPIVWTGYRFPEYPRLGALVFMPIYTISLGITAGWLYWFSGSIWVAALFNASANVTFVLSSAALGEAGGSRRVRIVWLWLWAMVAGFALAIWQAGQ